MAKISIELEVNDRIVEHLTMILDTASKVFLNLLSKEVDLAQTIKIDEYVRNRNER